MTRNVLKENETVSDVAENVQMVPICQPPEHLRDRDGYHWLNGTDSPVRWQHEEQVWEWNEDDLLAPHEVPRSYSYLGPVMPHAAASDLLAELKRVTDHLSDWTSAHSMECTAEIDAALHCARAAIARATGGGA